MKLLGKSTTTDLEDFSSGGEGGGLAIDDLLKEDDGVINAADAASRSIGYT